MEQYSTLYIDSSKRDVTIYPNANNFRMILGKPYARPVKVILTHFVMLAGIIPGNYLYVDVEELTKAQVQYGNSINLGQYLVTSNASTNYVSQEGENDDVIAQINTPSLRTVTISILDNTGTLIPITDYILRFKILSLETN